ncbi:MAG: prohibitin family protein [Clostridia bacterium]|nr:prohibitin family protein [Clostridia bacterium]
MTSMQGQSNKPVKMRGGAVAAAVVAGIILIAAFMCFVTVPPGHSGVVVTLGRVSDHVLSDGLHFKLPWQNVVLMDNRAQKKQFNTQAFSSDIQQVDLICSINFSVDRATSQNLYKNVGVAYYETVMLPRILENLKAVFSKYTAENLVGAREVLSVEVRALLLPEMKAFGIDILSVAIENIDFTDAFTDAVEAKQVAEQTKLKTQIQQEEQLVIERTSAERVKIAADADAAVARIAADARAYAVRAQAEAEAEANKLVAQSITEQLIRYVQANGWDGKLPQFISGESGMIPVINLDPGGQ